MKKLLAIMMALVMCCSLVVMAAATEEEGYVYEGEGFKITSSYEFDDSDWGVDMNGDGEIIGYGLYLEDFEAVITVSSHEKGYRATQEWLKEDNATKMTISGRDAARIDYDSSILLVTYSDEYYFSIELTTFGEEDLIAMAEDIITGLEITATATPPTVEEMEEAGVTVKSDATTQASGDNAEGGSNVVIIIVVAVAVVAVVAVVIVVATKKKK